MANNGSPIFGVGTVQSTNFLGRVPMNGYNASLTRAPSAYPAVNSKILVGAFVGRVPADNNMSEICSMDTAGAVVVGFTPRNNIPTQPQPATVADVIAAGDAAFYDSNIIASVLQDGEGYAGVCGTISAADINANGLFIAIVYDDTTNPLQPIYPGYLVPSTYTTLNRVALTGASLGAFAGDYSAGFVYGDTAPVQFNFINN